MSAKPEWIDQLVDDLRDLDLERDAGMAKAADLIQRKVKAVGLQSAEFLASKWEIRAAAIDTERQNLDAHFSAILGNMIAKTKILRECAEELRKHVRAAGNETEMK